MKMKLSKPQAPKDDVTAKAKQFLRNIAYYDAEWWANSPHSMQVHTGVMMSITPLDDALKAADPTWEGFGAIRDAKIEENDRLYREVDLVWRFAVDRVAATREQVWVEVEYEAGRIVQRVSPLQRRGSVYYLFRQQFEKEGLDKNEAAYIIACSTLPK
jgi:hypothetical protein